MSQLNNTRRSYDAVADRYAAEIADELIGKPLDRALLDAFAEMIPNGPVADVGCGPGQIGRFLAGRGATVVGTDLSPAMCRTASIPACASDMTALPFRTASLAGLVCFYAVIHLDHAQCATAYREFARVLSPGGSALITFHTSDAETSTGDHRELHDWWGNPVDLTFRFLDPDDEVATLTSSGFELTARLDRAPHPGVEHASFRTYLLLRRVDPA